MKPVWTARRHLVTWTFVGVLALAYIWNISGLALPQLSASLLPVSKPEATSLRRAEGSSAEPASPRPAGPRRQAMRSDETAALRKEIRVLRRQVEQLARREETLNERLSALESALGPQTSALPPQQPLDPAAAAKRRQSRLSAPVPGADVTYLPLPEDGFASTGVTPSPLPVASIAKTTRTLFAIEVAKAASMEELMERWKTLKKKHEDLLGALKLRTQKSERGDGSRAELKLVAGPFSNAADAAKLCAKLKAAGAACAETVFTGEEM